MLSLSVGIGLDDVEVDIDAIVSSSIGMALLDTELFPICSKPVGVDGAEDTGVVESLLNGNSSTSDG